jgi:hypothetical protein
MAERSPAAALAHPEPPTPLEPPRGSYSVRQLARRWSVNPDKIRGWLRRGELQGVNVAGTLAGRPQWRITAEAVARFEACRSSTPPPKPARRKKRTAIVDFYPD